MRIEIDKNNIPVIIEDADDKYHLEIGYNNFGIEIGMENSCNTTKQLSLQDLYHLKQNLEQVIKHLEMEINE